MTQIASLPGRLAAWIRAPWQARSGHACARPGQDMCHAWMRMSPSLFIALARVGLPVMITMSAACDGTFRAETPTRDEERITTLIDQLGRANGPPLVVAHRGCWRGSAENSLHAIEQCVDHGVDMVEIDVRRTADGELVVLHDANLDRMTNGTGPVAEQTLRDIRDLRLRSERGGPDAPLTGHRISTLREVLEASRGRILVNIDAKEDVHEEVVALTGQMRIQHQVVMKRTTIGAGPIDVIHRDVHFFMPVIDQRLVASAVGVVNSYGERVPAAFEIVYQSEDYLLDAMPEMKRLNARVWVNTLTPDLAAGLTDDEAMRSPELTWGRLLDQGVNIIQTDRPIELMAFLRESARRI